MEIFEQKSAGGVRRFILLDDNIEVQSFQVGGYKKTFDANLSELKSSILRAKGVHLVFLITPILFGIGLFVVYNIAHRLFSNEIVVNTLLFIPFCVIFYSLFRALLPINIYYFKYYNDKVAFNIAVDFRQKEDAELFVGKTCDAIRGAAEGVKRKGSEKGR